MTGSLHVDRGTETESIKEGGLNEKDRPGKLDRIMAVKVFKGKKVIMTMSPQQRNIIYTSETQARFVVFKL